MTRERTTETSAKAPRSTRVSRARSRRKQRFVAPFPVPRSVQSLFLRLPQVQAKLRFERRLFLVTLANRFESRITMNEFARLARVPASALSMWRKAYRKHGAEGLLPRHGGRSKAMRAGIHCALELFLKA